MLKRKTKKKTKYINIIKMKWNKTTLKSPNKIIKLIKTTYWTAYRKTRTNKKESTIKKKKAFKNVYITVPKHKKFYSKNKKHVQKRSKNPNQQNKKMTTIRYLIKQTYTHTNHNHCQVTNNKYN